MKTGAVAETAFKDPVFAGLTEEIRNDVIRLTEWRRFADGERLCGHGEPTDGVYIVVAGHLCLSATANDGRQHVLDIYSPGTWIGESSVLDGGPRACDNYSYGVVEILQLRPANLELLLERHYPLARAIMRLEAQRIRALVDLVQVNFVKPIENRLAHRLFVFSRMSDLARDAGRTLEIELTQETIAQMIGATRQRVNQVLRRWQKAGIVDLLRGGGVHIRDRSSLEALSCL